MNGKGSNPRPLSVSREEYRKRWDETFIGPRRYSRKQRQKDNGYVLRVVDGKTYYLETHEMED